MPSTDIYAANASDTLDAFGTTYEAFMSLRLSEQRNLQLLAHPVYGFLPPRDVAQGLVHAHTRPEDCGRGSGRDIYI
jgi:hypothetical protein